MNAKRLVQRMTAAGILAACVMGASPLWADNTPASATPSVAAPPVAPGPEEIAIVNGKEINPQVFDNVLKEVAGLRVFQEFMDLVLVQQACIGAGISVTGPDFDKLVEAERQRTLAEMPADKDSKPEDREKILNKVLQDKGVTRSEFFMGLQRQAGLRLLAKGHVDAPTTKEIQDYFTAHYGPIARMIVFTVKDEKQTVELRDALKKNPDIRAAATALQIQGTEIRIPSNNEDAAPISTFKDLAFGTAKTTAMKVNELSATIDSGAAGSEKHFAVYLEEMIPKQDVLLETPSVHAKVVEDLQALKESNWMQNQLQRLRANATIEVKDPILKSETDYIMDQMKKQREALATQPGTPPATPVAPVTPAPAPGK